MRLKQQALALAIGSALSLGVAQTAGATTIITFGQSASGSPVTATNNNAGTTTITATSVATSITQIDAALGTPISADFTLNATSIGAATLSSGFVTQEFSGSFSITSGTTNYLSGNFVDAVFGLNAGASLTLSSAQPPQSLTFTSDVITDLGLARGFSLSFASVDPGVGITAGSLSSFTSSFSGTASANVGAVPEPATLLLFGSGLVGLATRFRRRL